MIQRFLSGAQRKEVYIRVLYLEEKFIRIGRKKYLSVSVRRHFYLEERIEFRSTDLKIGIMAPKKRKTYLRRSAKNAKRMMEYKQEGTN